VVQFVVLQQTLTAKRHKRLRRPRPLAWPHPRAEGLLGHPFQVTQNLGGFDCLSRLIVVCLEFNFQERGFAELVEGSRWTHGWFPIEELSVSVSRLPHSAYHGAMA